MKTVWDFRDTMIPAAVQQLVKEGQLTSHDLLLMFIISAQTRHGPDSVGCFASDEYLGESLSMHPNAVNRALSRMRERGFMLIFRVKNRRYLELEWSRTEDERKQLRGEYGDKYRKNWAKMHETPRESNQLNPNVKLIAQLNPSVNNQLNPSVKSPILTKRERIESSPLPPKGGKGEFKTRQPTVFTKTQPVTKSQAQQFAERLAAVAQQHGKLTATPNLRNWTRAFATLLEARTPEQVASTLEAHANHLRDQYWPKAYCAESFVRKYPSIEDAMDRNRKSATENRDAPTETKAGQRVLDMLTLERGIDWHYNLSKRKMRAAIEMSLVNAKPWFRAFRNHWEWIKETYHVGKTNWQNGRGYEQLYDWLIENTDLFSSPTREQFVVRWFMYVVYPERITWEKWNGNIVKDAWRADHPLFLKLLSEENCKFNPLADEWFEELLKSVAREQGEPVHAQQ